MKKQLLLALLSLQLIAVVLAQPRSAAPPQSPPQKTQQPASTPTPTPPESDDVVRITTNLIQVDAVITDKNGKAVTDLRPDEVELYEDGKKQQITHFQYYANEPVMAAAGDAADKRSDKTAPPLPNTHLTREGVQRTIAIVVDDLGISYESVYYIRRALKKFVDEQLQPNDLVAIIRTRGGMSALQQFTSDKRQLQASIEQIKWYAPGRGGLSAVEPMGMGSTAGATPGPDDPKEDLDRFRDDVLKDATLRAISYVIRGLQELPGRKSILLVSDGLSLSNEPDKNHRLLDGIRILTEQANRAAVVINTMDSRALQPLGITAADNPRSINMRTGQVVIPRSDQVARMMSDRARAFSMAQDGLIAMAEGTGGVAIRNTNDLAGGIKKVLDDQKGYYLIGYRPDTSFFDSNGQEKFHNLKLRVTRAGKFEIRTRSGFFGVEDKPRTPTQNTVAEQMVRALLSPFAASSVHLQLTPLFANDPTIGSFIRALLHIDTRDLKCTEGSDHQYQCAFDVLAMTFGADGSAVDQVHKNFTVTLPEQSYRQVVGDGIVYYLTVPIKRPGSYQLRVAVRDSASERIGSSTEFIEVPDLTTNRLTLSGLTISGTDPRETTAGGQVANQSQQSVTEEVANYRVETSAALRKFSRGTLMDYVFIIYNSSLEKTTNLPRLTTQLRLFRDGKEVFSGRVAPVDLTGQTDVNRIVVAGRLQLGTVLSPGEYVAQIVVTDLLADGKRRLASQWTDFEILE